jgi:hypothetical protein
MNNNIIKYMPQDQIRLCKQDTCIEARGENAKTIVQAVSVALFCAALYYISKIK